jgi:alcohol dehydrogenase (NADP+)
MIQSRGYAAHSSGAALEPFSFERRHPADHDLVIEILYCGICHSDLHYVEDQRRNRVFPVVPGHEIVGIVKVVGRAVTKFQIGDIAAIGCMIDSCRVCSNCLESHENMCDERPTLTYGGFDQSTGHPNFGGYSNNYVVDENYVVHVPETLDRAGVAPLLCAGITVFSPLRYWEVGPGQRVGVVGLGGLGHMAVKIARAMGAEVTVFTSSPGKSDDAIKFGARELVISTDAAQMASQKGSLDFILDTVSAPHDLNMYLALLRPRGTMCLLGVAPEPLSLLPISLILDHKALVGSNIGGIAETQEMLNFCGEHGITAEVELLPLEQVNVAYERLRKNDVRYRFVIDMSMIGR